MVSFQFLNLFYLFTSGCAGSLSLCRLFASCGAQVSHCGGFSCAAQALGCTGSTVVVHRLSAIFLDPGLNSCLLHCQVDSLPLSHQGSPTLQFLPEYMGRTMWPLTEIVAKGAGACSWWGEGL